MTAIFSYAIGDILIKIINIITIPIITRLLSVKDYGIINLLIAIAGFSHLIQQGGMDSALPAFLIKQNQEGKAQVVKTATIPLLIGIPLFFIIWNTLLFKSTLLVSIFSKTSFVLMIAGIYAFLYYPIFFWVLYVLRFLNRPRDYIKLNVFNHVTGKLSFILISFIYKGGLLLYFICYIVATTLSLIFSWRKLIPVAIKKAGVDSQLLRRMLSYGIPLVPGGLAYAAMVYMDRFMLGGMLGPSAVGTYALALVLASTVNIAHGWFSLAWSPYLVDLVTYSEPERYNRRINSILAFMNTGLLLIAVVAIIFSIYIIRIFAASQYKEAAFIFPLLSVWASLNVAHVVCNCGMIITKNSRFALPVTCAGLGLNLILNILLIPVLAGKGAALATIFGEIVIVFLWVFVTNRVLRAAYVKILAFLPQLILVFSVAIFFSFFSKVVEVSFLQRCLLVPIVGGTISLYGFDFIKRNDPMFFSEIKDEIAKFKEKIFTKEDKNE